MIRLQEIRYSKEFTKDFLLVERCTFVAARLSPLKKAFTPSLYLRNYGRLPEEYGDSGCCGGFLATLVGPSAF